MAVDLTLQALRDLLHYDPETGAFTWLVRVNSRVPAGARAGKIDPHGYVRIGIGGRHYLAHRLAWLYVTGEWPPAEIDHRDRDPGNNRWANLRDATHAQNQRNTAAQCNNTSGFKGVTWHKGRRKWMAFITVDGKHRNLGRFDTAEAAHAAYVLAATEHHGEFARAA